MEEINACPEGKKGRMEEIKARWEGREGQDGGNRTAEKVKTDRGNKVTDRTERKYIIEGTKARREGPEGQDKGN
jgi:hypothetical protein